MQHQDVVLRFEVGCKVAHVRGTTEWGGVRLLSAWGCRILVVGDMHFVGGVQGGVDEWYGSILRFRSGLDATMIAKLDSVIETTRSSIIDLVAQTRLHPAS